MSSTAHSVQLGVAAMLAYSLINTAQLVSSKFMHDNGWPSWHIMAPACLVNVFPYSLACFLSGTPAPAWRQVKWLIVRTLFVEVGFVCAATAIHISNAPGDVQALTSVNVVVAAAMGRLVLKERLRWIHSLALASSVVGALLISKPAFLFGGSSSSSTALLGHALALCAGGARAAALICARKCGQVSALHMSLALNIIAGLVFLTVPFTPLYELRSMDVCWQHPWVTLAWLVFHVLLIVVGLLGGSLGSMLCPAAVSATVFTGSGMVFGYGSQVFIFGRAPDLLTIAGSVLMLLAVVIMTVFRVQPALPSGEEGSGVEQGSPSPSVRDAATEDKEDDESLMSFAASEFAEFEGHTNAVRESLRLRKLAAQPESIGNSLAAVAKAVGEAAASA